MTLSRGGALRACLCTTLLLAACGRPAVRDSTERLAPLPAAPPDTSVIPDAIPRVEPRSRNGNPAFYQVFGKRYVVLASSNGYVERGVASWYGPGFHGVNTAMGEKYDMMAMTAAHTTLPLPTYARVSNLANGRSVVVRINDRGPFVANRLIDLSYSAALKLDIVRTGTAFVEVRALDPGAPLATDQPALAPLPSADTPDTPNVAPAMQDLPTQSLYIQVGAFGEQANADRAIRTLQAAGISNAFSVATQSNGQTLRRIRIGPIASVDQFDSLVARLAKLGYPQARLAQD